MTSNYIRSLGHRLEKHTGFWIGLILLSPYLLQVLLGSYDPAGGDEAYQVQAAKELLAGRGYTASLYSAPADLAERQYIHLDSWPIGYTLLLAAPAAAGLSFPASIKLIKFFAILIGLWFWGMLIDRQANIWMRIGLAALVAAHFPLWGNYTTAALAWALFAACTVYVERAFSTSSFSLFWWCSALLAVGVLLRYQSLSVLPPFFLVCLLTYWPKRKQAIARAASVMLLPACAFVFTYVFNLMLAEGGTFLVRRESGWFWAWRWIPEATLGAFVGGTYRMDEAIYFLSSKFPAGEGLKFLAGLVTGLVCAILLWRARLKERFQLGWLILNLGSLLAMFFILAVRSKYESLNHGRYYHFFAPLILCLLWTGLQVSWPLKSPKLITYLALLLAGGAFLSNTVFAIHRAELASPYGKAVEAVTARIHQLQASESAEKVFLVADQKFPALVMETDWPVFMHVDPIRSMGFCATSPTLLVFVHEVQPSKIYFEQLHGLEDLVSSGLFQSEVVAGTQLVWRKLPSSITCPAKR